MSFAAILGPSFLKEARKIKKNIVCSELITRDLSRRDMIVLFKLYSFEKINGIFA